MRTETLVDKAQASLDLIYKGFGSRRQNVIDYTNLRGWTLIVIG
jgi:hypothetical protein